MNFKHEPIKGLRLTQNINIDNAFKLLQNIDIVIEIGTQYGGFAMFLRKMFPKAEIHTFDIVDFEEKNKHKLFKKYNIKYHKKDVFDKHTQSQISNLIKKGKSLVLCDGGDKINEFTLYGKHLKKGDYIGAHDYGRTKKIFKSEIENKIWTASCEVTWTELEDYCNNHGFERVFIKQFEEAVWLLCKKI
jgi:cephalosporin hydroxylase